MADLAARALLSPDEIEQMLAEHRPYLHRNIKGAAASPPISNSEG
jgi:hypothetical protein